MVNLPPESEQNRDRAPTGSALAPLSFEECVAVLVAFLAIGSILVWGLTRGGDWQTTSLLGLAAPTAKATESEAPPQNDEQLERSRESTTELGPQPENINRDNGSAILPPVTPDQPTTVDQNDRLVRRETAAVPVPVPVPTSTSTAAAPSTPTQSTTAQTPPVNIPDVPSTYWAYPFIAALNSAGLVANFPDGQFKPDQPMTRAEFAALLNTSFLNSSGGQQARNFTDISSNYWGKNAINRVVGTGYMQGYPEGDFRPDQLIPREQVLVTLASGLGLPDSPQREAMLNRFADGKAISEWARSRVAAATAAGLVVNNPDPTVLRPTEPATRAEVVAMMYQALAAQGRASKVESPYVVPGLQ